MNAIYFNNTLASAFGVSLLDGAYRELRKPAKIKEGLTNSWPDEHGTERDLSERFLESRTLTIPIIIEGSGEADFMVKSQAFTDWLENAEYFDLKVQRTNRIYKLVLSDISDYRDFYDHCTMNLILIDDFPHLKTPYA